MPAADLLWTVAAARDDSGEHGPVPPVLPGLSALHDLSVQQGGVVTRAQARSHGIDSVAVRRRVRSGAWQMRFGCIVLADHGRPDWRDAWAIGLRCGAGSVVSGPTAMRLNSWEVPDDLALAWCDRETHLRVPGLRLLRDSAPRRTRPGPACAIALPIDALLDTVLVVPMPRAIDLLDLALQRHWVTPQTWSEAVAGRLGRGRPGGARLRRLAQFAGSGTRSAAERLTATTLRKGGLTGWIANYPLTDSAGRVVAELDFALPDLQICIEVDGRAYHSDDRAFEHDRARQNMLVARGWIVLRFTWKQVRRDRSGWSRRSARPSPNARPSWRTPSAG